MWSPLYSLETQGFSLTRSLTQNVSKEILNFLKDHSGVIDIGRHLIEDGTIYFFQYVKQMVYFDNILEFLGAEQFRSFSLRFNLCFGTSARDDPSLFRLNGTIIEDRTSEDNSICKSAIMIQYKTNPFKVGEFQ